MTHRLAVTLAVLLMFTSCTAIAAPRVVCQIVTPDRDGLITVTQLRAIMQRTAAVIATDAAQRHVGISDALDSCRANEHMEGCVQQVLNVGHAAIGNDMHAAKDDAYLVLTARVNDGGFISGTAFFVTADGLWTAASYKLEPLDAKQRPRRGLDESRGRAEWFAADSTYLLSGRACEVAHRLGLSNEHKHVLVHAFDVTEGAINWPGEAIVR